ncbi:hypothetical protein BJN34_14500 [Cupriavidus necator]|uniref:Uncharacterized protein n=1 Tax=Cupriavidus necator TaxID=106590 RepID=A0A1U9URM0_CUPNE|nr:hypothetical protein BJN34_14500 [Cupriavidus necator]
MRSALGRYWSRDCAKAVANLAGHAQLPENMRDLSSMSACAHWLRRVLRAKGDGPRPTGGARVLARPRQWRAATASPDPCGPHVALHTGFAWIAHAMGAH